MKSAMDFVTKFDPIFADFDDSVSYGWKNGDLMGYSVTSNGQRICAAMSMKKMSTGWVRYVFGKQYHRILWSMREKTR